MTECVCVFGPDVDFQFIHRYIFEMGAYRWNEENNNNNNSRT